MVKINRKTVNNYYNDVREKILKETLKETLSGCGEFEVDESYFGAKCVRGVAGKTPIFVLLKRGGKVFVKVVENLLERGTVG